MDGQVTGAGREIDEVLDIVRRVKAERDAALAENARLLASVASMLDTERERIVDAISFQREWVRTVDGAIAVVRARIGLERRVKP